MRFEIQALRSDPITAAFDLRALVAAPVGVGQQVAEIVAAVRTGGDAAVLEYTERFDCPGVRIGSLAVKADVLAVAARGLAPELREGLELAIANVHAVASACQLPREVMITREQQRIRSRRVPVARGGVYVPGGRAPYPSTVVMGVITARAAGVQEVAVCAPPGPGGEIDSVVLAACELARASEVYRMGGAQAIAALAFGTETVPAVDVVVGPGNHYVQEAKRQVSSRVGIDGFAGPSDLLVIADGDSDPEPLALDLLAQAEHGPGTLVIAISPSGPLLERIADLLGQGEPSDAVARLVRVSSMEEALELAQAFAPEHLQLVGSQAEALAPRTTRAGCLFVGADAATAFGDYVAGSNHILPTGGAARFASALSPTHFQRSFSEVRISDPTALARAAAPLARAEGFELHARSMEARIRDNGGHDPHR